MFALIILVIVIFLILYFMSTSKSTKEKQYKKTADFRKEAKGQIFCPHCGCTQISFDVKRKNHCMKCGFDWYPWQYEHLYKD